MSDAFADLMQALPPERLVPGDPDATDRLAQSMLQFSELFADAAQALGKVDVMWTGQAARDFHNEFELQPVAFKRASTAFDDAGYALGSHAISMDSARKAAAIALEVFQRGVRAAHEATNAASGGMMPTSGPLDLRTVQAGMQDRLAGVEKLEAAREQLDRSGADAARKLRDAIALAPAQTSAMEHLLNFVKPQIPGSMSDEKFDFTMGGARGLLDLASLGAPTLMGPDPISWVQFQVTDLQLKAGSNPGSGWSTGGSIIIPAVASFGIEGAVVRGASLFTRPTATAPRILVKDVITDIPKKGVNPAPLSRGAEGPNGQAPIDVSDIVLPARRLHILDGETYPNGNHGGGHRFGTGFSKKSEFPADWSDDRIMEAAVDVATDPLSTTHTSWGPGDIFYQGTRDGIDIEVLVRNGELWTAYPTNVARNP